MTIYIDYLCPIGLLYLVSNGDSLIGCYYTESWRGKGEDFRRGEDCVLENCLAVFIGNSIALALT
jgi:hypothetical protein